MNYFQIRGVIVNAEEKDNNGFKDVICTVQTEEQGAMTRIPLEIPSFILRGNLYTTDCAELKHASVVIHGCFTTKFVENEDGKLEDKMKLKVERIQFAS